MPPLSPPLPLFLLFLYFLTFLCFLPFLCFFLSLPGGEDGPGVADGGVVDTSRSLNPRYSLLPTPSKGLLLHVLATRRYEPVVDQAVNK
jgi:hypothetical protein